jgi:nucleotide-binding universal stress UspA family protein
MRVLLWIAEGTWEACVDGARAVVGDGAQIALVHVAAPDVEAVAAGAHAGLLGRRARRPAPLAELSREEAQGLLELARDRLGREAELIVRRGRPEREIVAAAREADLLVVARDGAAPGGPGSIGPRARFVLDHAPCPVLLVPGTEGTPPPGPPPGSSPAPGGPPPPPGPGPAPLPSEGR